MSNISRADDDHASDVNNEEDHTLTDTTSKQQIKENTFPSHKIKPFDSLDLESSKLPGHASKVY